MCLFVAHSSLHKPFRIPQRHKPTLAIKVMRVARHEYPATQSAKFGMCDDGLDEPLTQTAPAMLLDDENVRKISKRGSIGNYACEADLRLFVVNAKTE